MKAIFIDDCFHWKPLPSMATPDCRHSPSLRLMWSSSVHHRIVTRFTRAHPLQKILKSRSSPQFLLQSWEHAGNHFCCGFAGCLLTTSGKAPTTEQPATPPLTSITSNQGAGWDAWTQCARNLVLRCLSCTHRKQDKDTHTGEQLKPGAEDSCQRHNSSPVLECKAPEQCWPCSSCHTHKLLPSTFRGAILEICDHFLALAESGILVLKDLWVQNA